MDKNNIEQHLYDKTVTCPICSNEFTVKCAKINSPRIKSKDSDFFIHYSVINPYFYDIWICNQCGYAAPKKEFPKIKSSEKNSLIKNLAPKWKPRTFPLIQNEETALERYKLALLTATFTYKDQGYIAFLLLKIAWMYRLLQDTENEISFLQQSLKCFEKAFINEPFPICGLQRDSLTYLIGELYRRIGDDTNALSWFSKVITTIGASQKVKELARDGKDLISSKKEEVVKK